MLTNFTVLHVTSHSVNKHCLFQLMPYVPVNHFPVILGHFLSLLLQSDSHKHCWEISRLNSILWSSYILPQRFILSLPMIQLWHLEYQLTLFILIDFHIIIDRISMYLPILYFKGSQVKISIHCPWSFFILANSADPDEMPHYAAFHLGLHYLLK